MGGLFGKTAASIPAPAPPPPPPTPPAPPTIDASAIKTRQDQDAFARRQGSEANIKSKDKTAPTTMAAQLLGS